MEKNQDSYYNCGLCMDTGYLLYEKKYPDTVQTYTTATHCTCEIGQGLATGYSAYINKEKVRSEKGKPVSEERFKSEFD